MRLASFFTLVFDSSGSFCGRILGYLRSFAEAIESCQPSYLDLWVLVMAVASNCEGAILCSQALVLHDFPGSYDFPPYSMTFCDNLWSSMVVHNILWYFCDILRYSMAFDNIPWSSMIFYERLCVWHLFTLWSLIHLGTSAEGFLVIWGGSRKRLSLVRLHPSICGECMLLRSQAIRWLESYSGALALRYRHCIALRRRHIVFKGIGTPWSSRILWFPTVFYDILCYSIVFYGSP